MSLYSQSTTADAIRLHQLHCNAFQVRFMILNEDMTNKLAAADQVYSIRALNLTDW